MAFKFLNVNVNVTMFQVRRDSDPMEGSEHILALNKHGVHFLDLITHETILHYPFTEVISTRQMETEDGVLYLDMKCGNLMQQRISRIQTDQAVEIARLIKQYITIGTQAHHYFFLDLGEHQIQHPLTYIFIVVSNILFQNASVLF